MQSFEPITRVDIRNYGKIRDLTVPLLPMQAFVGPPDMGKTTILHAITLATSLGFEPWNGSQCERVYPGKFDIQLSWADGLAYQVARTDEKGVIVETLRAGGAAIENGTRSMGTKGCLGRARANKEHLRISHRLERGAVMLQPSFTSLVGPSPLITDTDPLFFYRSGGISGGYGLGAVLYAIRERNLDHFIALHSQVRALFPHVSAIAPRLERQMGDREVRVNLAVRLRGSDTLVERERLGLGLVSYLTYACLAYCDLPALLVVHEPEHGIHPAYIEPVMEALRTLTDRTQVLIETHSPLVVNELSAEETSLVLGAPEGIKVMPLSETPAWKNAQKVYVPGEYWVSYCDGKTEHEMFRGGEEKKEEAHAEQ